MMYILRTTRTGYNYDSQVPTHSWLADGGPEKCSPEHFTSKFKAKFIGWIYTAATKTPIKL